MSKRFADRSTARSHMIKEAREIYRLELEETFSITKENISLKSRHVYFRSNTVHEVWIGKIKDTDTTRYLICDTSSGNIALLDDAEFNSKK